MATQSITTQEVRKAAAELQRMRTSLTSWLKYRRLNDRVLAGTVPTKRPLPYAQGVVAQARDMRVEQDLANNLHALLQVVMKGQPLPNADLRTNPQGAVELAEIAIMGGAQVPSPVATDGLFTVATPWMWPLLIVGGLLVVSTIAIGTLADIAKDKEEKACIQAGACTDYGFWLKLGGISMLAWLAWEKLGGRELVHSITKKGRS